MIRKTLTLATAAAAAGLLACGAGSNAAPSAAAQPLLRIQSPFVTDSATAAATIRCLASGAAVAVLSYHGSPSQPATYATVVNGIRTRSGALRADRRGLFVVPTQVRNGTRSRVVLQLNRRDVVNTVVSPACRAATAPVAGPAAVTITGTRGSSTSFSLNYNKNGSVTRWDPCGGDIHVRVNAASGGTGALTDAQAALSAISRASGLHLIYDGTTSFVPSASNSASQPAAIVIAWAAPGTGAGLSDYYQSGAVGEGGWRSSGVSNDGGATWTWKITQGFVVLDPAVTLSGGFGNGQSRGALLLHELGHVAGLGHTSDASQVMYPVLRSSSYGSYGAGDLGGLTAVGASKGCVSAS
jgi:hypothetical protein